MIPETDTRNTKRGWALKRWMGALMLALIPMLGLSALGASAASAVEPSTSASAAVSASTAEAPKTATMLPSIRPMWPWDNDDEDTLRFKFYNVASGTTGFFSTMQAPGKEEALSDSWSAIVNNPGSAGSVMGYADPDITDFFGWLSSNITGASDGRGYDSVRESDGSLSGATAYGLFGATLSGLGLDQTATGLSDAGTGIISWVGGGIVLVLYILSAAVDALFSAFIGLLSVLNPFRLFYLGVGLVGGADLANGMTGGGGLGGPLQGLTSFIGGWYQVISSISWTVMVPLFIVTLIVSLFALKKGSRGGAVKRFIVRLLFIGLGLPLLGSMYTGMLSSMTEGFDAGKSGSTRAVLSTFVDFQGWAYQSRLAVPNGAHIEWNSKEEAPTTQSANNIRNTTLAINNQTYRLGITSIVSAGSGSSDWSSHLAGADGDDVALKDTGAYVIAIGMLDRYMNSHKVNAATFEDQLQGDLNKSKLAKADEGKTVTKWFESLQKKTDNMKDLDDPAPSANPIIAVAPGTGLQAVETNNRVKFTSNSPNCLNSGLQLRSESVRDCNLSPVAMYNYLNTSFGPDAMTVSSSIKSGSEGTREFHKSVNLVGTGVMSFFYWLNTVVVLGSFVVIGFGYAFSMLFASIRRSIQIVGTVPFASLGAMAAIAKLIVYTFALILEVIGTVFVYKLVQEFLTSLPQIFEMGLQSMLKIPVINTLSNGGWNFALVGVLVTIIGGIIFLVMALRVRKSLLKAAQEAVTKLTEKFLDSPVGAGGGGGGMLAPALAGGVAGGAGMAAANRMMNNSSKGATPGDSAADPNGGPGGVTTADSSTGSADGEMPAQGQLEAGSGQPGDSPEGGASGNGDPGAAPQASGVDVNVDNTSEDVALGRDVEANGLSEPGQPGQAGETRDPQVGDDDATSAATDSLEKSAEAHKEADKERLSGGVKGVKAAGHAGLAVGKGFGGDAAGAAESGGRALQHGGAAAASGHRAKQIEEDADRSSLDKPNQKHANRAAQADKVSQAGGMVADTAGKASATSGGGATSGKGPQGLSKPKSQSASKPAPSPQAPKPAPAPKAPAPAPAPRSASQPKPQAPRQPKPQAPRPSKPRGPRPGGPAKQ